MVRRLLAAARDPAQVPAVRAALEASLHRLVADLVRDPRAGEPADQALRATLAADIQRWLARPAAIAAGPPGAADTPPELPPGPPIGGWDMADECEWRAGPHR